MEKQALIFTFPIKLGFRLFQGFHPEFDSISETNCEESREG